MNKQTVSAGTRLGSMMLDHFFMTFVCIVFFIPTLIVDTIAQFSMDTNITTDYASGKLMCLALVGFAAYFCKDSINGRSLAKRILRLQVVENSTGKVASPIRCFVRNIFCVLWPIEIIVTLASPARRIGDFVAGTRVAPFDAMLEKPKLNYGQIAISFCLAYGLLLLILLPLNSLRLKSERHKNSFGESAYNEQESKDLEKIFADSLGQKLSANIKVFDTVQHKPVKFITVFMNLKQNELEDNTSKEKLEGNARHLLKAQFPNNPFFLSMNVIYKTKGYTKSESFFMNSDVIDTGKSISY